MSDTSVTTPGERLGGDAGNQLAENLATIGTATRLLATRVAELEAEIERQAVAVEQSRLRLAAAMAAARAPLRSVAERQGHDDELARLREELAQLRATRLFRWSAGPRRVYRGLRLAAHPGQAYQRVRSVRGAQT